MSAEKKPLITGLDIESVELPAERWARLDEERAAERLDDELWRDYELDLKEDLRWR